MGDPIPKMCKVFFFHFVKVFLWWVVVVWGFTCGTHNSCLWIRPLNSCPPVLLTCLRLLLWLPTPARDPQFPFDLHARFRIPAHAPNSGFTLDFGLSLCFAFGFALRLLILAHAFDLPWILALIPNFRSTQLPLVFLTHPELPTFVPPKALIIQPTYV